jgi:hypothetical protein
MDKMIFDPCKYALELLMASIFDLTSKNPINAISTQRETIILPPSPSALEP